MSDGAANDVIFYIVTENFPERKLTFQNKDFVNERHRRCYIIFISATTNYLKFLEGIFILNEVYSMW